MESLILSALLLAESSSLATDILAKVQAFGLVALGLGFVIFVHELGHFLVAKACGVKCEKFYVGFDVPLNLGLIKIPGKLFHFQYGETEYGIGAIPLGGYVKMLGQDDNPENAEAEEERTKIRDEQGNVKLDPRSYQAKSVPARMAIISAGVIMNLIFGFIFATIAYKVGVKIQPAVIGSTSPGDPAWQYNLQPGDRILQMGDSPRNEHMRFVKDMMLNLALYGEFDKPIEVVVRHPNGVEESLQLIPSNRHKESKDLPRPTFGIAPSRSTMFGRLPAAEMPLQFKDLLNFTATDDGQPVQIDNFSKLQQLLASRPALVVEITSKVAPGDKLLAIDGEAVNDATDLQRILAGRPEKTIKLTIERAPRRDAKDKGEATSTPEQYTIEVGPRPLVDYGLVMKVSPITAVQKDSPAAKAGIQAGDKLVSFGGEPIGDPLVFPHRTLSRIGETVALEVERGSGKDAKQIQIDVPLRAPAQALWSPTICNIVAVETMGIAYEVIPKVAEVRPGSSAEGKLQVGDEIVKVQFKTAGAAQKAVETAALHPIKPEKEIPLDSKLVGWPILLYSATVDRMPDSKMVVTAKRGEQVIEAELAAVRSKEMFIDDHGLPLIGLEEMQVAATWGEAAQLGFRELKERVTEVFTVVTRLVTGRISLFQMGGPITIFRVAGSEAERGVTDLLMFLTFLSANLAVLNFLPIPVLDGGHFLFLLYEGIRRKPVDANLQMKLSMGGLLLLLGLMLFVTVLDVQRLFW